MNSDITTYLEKARESLASAQSELDNRRYNCSANRSYYACFQAAVYALLGASVPWPRSGKWRHEYVKGHFATELIHRRKHYPAELAAILERSYKLREEADYEDYSVSKPQSEASSAQHGDSCQLSKGVREYEETDTILHRIPG